MPRKRLVIIAAGVIVLAGAVAAMQDEAHLHASLAALCRQRVRLAKALEQRGFRVYPSQANFVTAGTPRPASQLMAALAERGLRVQALPWPGGPGSLRITIGDAADVDAVTRALDEALAGPLS